MGLVEAITAVADVTAWWEEFAAVALGPVLRADVVAVATLDYRPDVRATGMFGLIRPAWAELAVPTGSAMHRDLLDDHPFTAHLRSPHGQQVVRVSDLVGERRWRGMAGHAKMRELIGATNQLSIPVAGAPLRSVAVSPIRAASDFTDREVVLARRLQTVAVLADRHFDLLTRSSASPGPAAAALGLTARERIVLGLLADGRSAAAIARTLAISPRTVQKHQENLYRKLDVGDRLSAVVRARHQGLVP